MTADSERVVVCEDVSQSDVDLLGIEAQEPQDHGCRRHLDEDDMAVADLAEGILHSLNA